MHRGQLELGSACARDPALALLMDAANLRDFARRYAAAWCSQDPRQVADCFAEDGSLRVNHGAPAVGRAAIAEIARSFMQAIPDMKVALDAVTQEPARTVFHWTLTGTNTGPGGGGNKVRISGYEIWQLSEAGLIAESRGHFDAADYERQLRGDGPS